ncbi:histidine kinase,Response regulator receiver domain protein,histidine kinase [Thiorhodovibrio frisius]|uniref:histidine kinase n=2 Tax=Thiorhodovibrio frisius TaxID=631362 RepID=H8Z676_9GAMM|nr:histidine kinase,Response regulator receiver domain protein,histidine kinase [Thiorhodovibrio frisius]WPL20391.1 Autoinducer 2 sensor kinase/phosphatase LuxQ [Thiorhodovibrio frisius]
MSHEIRTPLNGVQGFLQLLGMCDLDPEAAEYVDSAMDSSQSLLTLINDILDFSKIEAGKFSIECEPFAVDALVRSVVNTFSPKVASKGITLNAAIDPGVDALVVGDEARLRQVLFNLIGNAVKFTDHGEVRLDVRALESIDGERIRLQFTVMDTGVGISADNIPDLFEPFTQADSSLRRRFQGSGLGLAIVKRLVSLMGGQVVVDSDLGRGTTVRFDIVVGTCAEDASTDNNPVLADHQAGESQGKLLRALVVDDEPINANLLCRILEKLGHSPETACNGRQALEMLSAQRFDVVFMDVSMPEMDGIKATRLIRGNQNGDLDASIPIIAMTAHAMEGDREKCLAAGMDWYLSKPIDTKALHRVLDCFMEGEARCNPTE